MDLVVPVGQVFGGGMRVAPAADPSDGLFDVQIHFGSKLDYVRGIAKVYRGTHLPHPRIREVRCASVQVGCDPPGLIEADGEVVGVTPATFRVLPGALRLKG
jgi:diacylglycerol kinase family enzyme